MRMDLMDPSESPRDKAAAAAAWIGLLGFLAAALVGLLAALSG